MLILPAILEKSQEEFSALIKQVSGADWIHIDLSDGQFTPEQTLQNPPGLKEAYPEINFEVHLMVANPWQWWESWVQAGIKRVIFHFESFLKLSKKQRKFGVNNLINNIIRQGAEIGMAFQYQTDLSYLQDFSSKLNLVHLMSIAEIGYQGHPFQEGIVERIQEVKQLYPELKIAVDGGVNEQNIQLLAKAGVDQVAVGSAIFHSDNPAQQFQKLQELANMV